MKAHEYWHVGTVGRAAGARLPKFHLRIAPLTTNIFVFFVSLW
jgi:hypothetical protein